MNGGTISDNSSSKSDGGVHVSGTFTKSGGVIYRSNVPDEPQSNKAQDDKEHAVVAWDIYGNITKKRKATVQGTSAVDTRKG